MQGFPIAHTSHIQPLLHGLCGKYSLIHRPYSRQVTERMECDVAKHTPPSVYPKAGNRALWDQWRIKYNCQNDSPTIVFTVRDLVHLERGNCNYCHPNMGVGQSDCTDNDLLNNVNMMVQ